MEQNPTGIDPEVATARKSMGFESKPEVNDSPEGEPEKKEPEEKSEPETEPKEESKSEEESEEEESEEEESKKEEDEESGEKEDVENQPPAKTKPSLVERRIFKQIGELNGKLDKFIESQSQKSPAKDELEELSAELGEELNTEDPEGLKKLLQGVTKIIDQRVSKNDHSKELESLKETLASIQGKLKSVDAYDAERETKQQRSDFVNEWNSLVPALKQQFPNAGDAELAEAKRTMDEIAHSPKGGIVVTQNGKQVVQGYPLDFILYSNRKAFETILKTASKSKSGEVAKGEARSEGEEEHPKLRQDRINSEQVKRYEETHKQNLDDDGVEKLSF